jgi:hypothetical protein
MCPPQCFGEKDNDEEFSEADVLSAVRCVARQQLVPTPTVKNGLRRPVPICACSVCRFDETGDYLATGDKGGRIVIFERAEKGVSARCSIERRTVDESFLL